MAKKFLGIHVIAELHGCNPEILNNPELITQILLKAAKDAKVTVVDYITKKFEPQGVSAVVVISESHITIHTWPEIEYAALDFYTCGEEDPEKAVREIAKDLGTREMTIFKATRGNINKIKKILKQKRENGEDGKNETRAKQIQVLL